MPHDRYTPAERFLAYTRNLPWTVTDVVSWSGPKRNLLYAMFDFVCLRPDEHSIVGIVPVVNDGLDPREKLRSVARNLRGRKHFRDWLLSGGKIEIWSFRTRGTKSKKNKQTAYWPYVWEVGLHAIRPQPHHHVWYETDGVDFPPANIASWYTRGATTGARHAIRDDPVPQPAGLPEPEVRPDVGGQAGEEPAAVGRDCGSGGADALRARGLHRAGGGDPADAPRAGLVDDDGVPEA